MSIKNISANNINDYNNFLKSMDRITTNTKIRIKPKKTTDIDINDFLKITSASNVNSKEGKKIKEKVKEESQDIEETIKKLINQIEDTYKLEQYDSPSFTGWEKKEINQSKLRINDENLFIEHDYVIKPKKKKDTSKKPLQPIEKITIETDVNSIDDILQLINTYKVEPSIEYNINMKMLHNIKEPLIELNSMIGMKDLKNNLLDQILYFSQELHKSEKENCGDFMHSVIYGPPGTGKTEIAKMIGKIYSKMGILTSGVFKKVTRSDLISGYLGQTALKTRDVIKECLGGVLFIDEAYALGNSEKRDTFSKECIDTLCEALSDHKDNLMVIIAGYERELKECFFAYNQGLDSRFTWRFKTDKYSAGDLKQIFDKKVHDIGWKIDKQITTISWFEKNMDYFKFFGRDIEILLSKVKIAHSKRAFCKPNIEKKSIQLIDMDNGLKMFLENEEVKNRKEQNSAIYSMYV